MIEWCFSHSQSISIKAITRSYLCWKLICCFDIFTGEIQRIRTQTIERRRTYIYHHRLLRVSQKYTILTLCWNVECESIRSISARKSFVFFNKIICLLLSSLSLQYWTVTFLGNASRVYSVFTLAELLTKNKHAITAANELTLVSEPLLALCKDRTLERYWTEFQKHWKSGSFEAKPARREYEYAQFLRHTNIPQRRKISAKEKEILCHSPIYTKTKINLESGMHDKSTWYDSQMY